MVLTSAPSGRPITGPLREIKNMFTVLPMTRPVMTARIFFNIGFIVCWFLVVLLGTTTIQDVSCTEVLKYTKISGLHFRSLLFVKFHSFNPGNFGTIKYQGGVNTITRYSSWGGTYIPGFGLTKIQGIFFVQIGISVDIKEKVILLFYSPFALGIPIFFRRFVINLPVEMK
jgi:hypothetical protein